MASPTQIPGATYRLQLNSSFTFADACAVIPYLDNLGVTDCYLSPILTAQPGSLHGYDVTDPDQINPELGGLEAFLDFAGRLAGRGMRIVLDIVPNHMCISDPGNRWWQDVLENGPSSPHARYFDIDWRPPREALENKVLLPVLGDQYGRVLESGLIRLMHRAGTFGLAVYDKLYPVAPRTWSHVLEPALAQVKSDGTVSTEDIMEFESIITALRYLPPRTETDDAKVRERQRLTPWHSGEERDPIR
jgi:(1->4)-alpha-D-glucan 1-alpha-D-glucosylmutase